MSSNLYEIDKFRAGSAGLPARCFCGATRVGQEFLAQELKQFRGVAALPSILRLESLDRSVPDSASGWDLIYSTSLLSTLPQRAAHQVVKLAAARLNPAGCLIFVNPGSEAGLEWCRNCGHTGRVCRSELEMAELARDIPQSTLAGSVVYRDNGGQNVYLELHRAAS